MIAFLAIWTIVTVVAVTWETHYDWPDNVHRDYGLPFVWSTQTLSTIVGPVDLWVVDVFSLTLDLAFWLAIMLVATPIMLVLFRERA